MSSILFSLNIILFIIVALHFLFPLCLRLLSYKRSSRNVDTTKLPQADYAIIVTFYGQIDLLPGLLSSIQRLNYENFMVYIVADNCGKVDFEIDDAWVILLEPERVLQDNVKSHRYAIQNFVRAHDRITILDGDNLVHPDYLMELNKVFDQGYAAVQGAREAKNLNNDFANLDGVGDLYYRYIDRKLLFSAGSSAALSGSGMAFSADLYTDCIRGYNERGAGFDKILQYEIVKRGERIAFTNEAVVFDQKTTSSGQLVKQRARWLNTWFKTIGISLRLLGHSIVNWSRNGFLFSLMLLRPPLFILFALLAVSFLFNIFYYPILSILLIVCVIVFFFYFFGALRSFNAPKSMYKNLASIPKFVFFQVLALFKIRVANRISTATEHSIIEIDNSNEN